MHPADPPAVAAGFDALVGAGATAVTERDLVPVVGPDSGRYLQGQLSQEVVALGDGASAWSLLLHPTGKVQSWLRVHRVADDAYALDVDAGYGDAVVARLCRFLLRTEAEVGEAERRVVLSRRHGAGHVELGRDPAGVAAGALAGVVVGPGVAGIDRILPAGTTIDLAESAAEADGDVVPRAALERYRIVHGLPAMGAELTDDTIPAEAGGWLVETSVSFTKGCYTGQELVARIDSRGNTVPRPVRVLRFDDAPGGEPIPGSTVRLDDKEVGVVTSVAPSLGPGHPAVALATVARAVAVGTTVSVGPEATPAVVADPASDG
ncbi:MAG: hypothetical protein MUE36_11875 [Acidimicrobiales bacterium]|jgi:folate-binding protein YgfZ|nr:hypothetical protein [Acidimicrobiales bacterium]